MFAKLFRQSQNARKSASPRVPDGVRVYCVGDIHGRADLLKALHRGIQADAAQSPPARNIVVYVGDYVDRGMHSREVIDHLLGDPLPGFEKVYLKGNHDDSLLQFLRDPDLGPTWFSYGGDATVLSYGVRMTPGKSGRERFEDMRQQLQANLPPSHLEFLQTLRLTFECGDYLFVHAGLRPGVGLEQQTAEDMMWIREDFLDSRHDFGKVVVHGHSVTETPEMRDNRIGIDTGAYASDTLTCLILEGDGRHFIGTEKARRQQGA
ncbi:MAG: metallophosphoesterase family protein [Reyranellaceae bacterium]